MKKSLKFGLLACVLFLFQSCVTLTPNDYEPEIEDAVKYHISLADLMIETQNNGASATLLFGWLAEVGLQSEINFITDSLETRIVDLYESQSEWTYRDAIEHLKSQHQSKQQLKYSKLAAKLLELYDATSVSLTEYESVRSNAQKKSWKFKELNSDIVFTFELSECDTDNMAYVISPLEKSYQKYVESNI